MADRARSVAGADVSWVVVGRDPDALVMEVVSGADADRDALRGVSMAKSLSAQVVRSQEPLTVADLGTEPGAVDPSAELGLPTSGLPCCVVVATSMRISRSVTDAGLDEFAAGSPW